MRRAFHYIPNALSLSRIPIAAIFLATYSVRDARMFWLAMTVIGVALLTDILDGRLARNWGIESETGYLLDGLGDKVFYAAMLLVIAREAPGHIFVAWTLLVRELVWYGIRVVDQNRQNLKFMRSLSVAYAFVIRLYFGAFVVSSWYTVYEFSPPAALNYYYFFGVTAAALGFYQIVALSKMIIVDFERTQNDRG